MILFKTSIRHFEFKTTAHRDKVKRKEELRDAILKEIKDPILEKIVEAKISH